MAEYADCLACGATHNHVTLWPIGDGSRWTFFVCPATQRTLVLDDWKGEITAEVVLGPDVAAAVQQALESNP